MMFITTAMLNVKLTVSGIDMRSVDKIRAILSELRHEDGTAVWGSSPQTTTVSSGDSINVLMETSLSDDDWDSFFRLGVKYIAYGIAGYFFRSLKESNHYEVPLEGDIALRYFYDFEVQLDKNGVTRVFNFEEADAIALSARVSVNNLVTISAPDWFDRKDFQVWRKEQPYLFGSDGYDGSDGHDDVVMTFDMGDCMDDEWEGSHVGGALDIPQDIKATIGKLIRFYEIKHGMLWIKPI